MASDSGRSSRIIPSRVIKSTGRAIFAGQLGQTGLRSIDEKLHRARETLRAVRELLTAARASKLGGWGALDGTVRAGAVLPRLCSIKCHSAGDAIGRSPERGPIPRASRVALADN